MFILKRNNLKRNNQRSQHAVVSSTSNSNSRNLWRLPHVFANMLELPFHSHADVSIEETPKFLRFVASCNSNINKFNANAGGVRAQVIEIVPGITKIVIEGMNGSEVTVAGHHHQQQHLRHVVDIWRFRLPAWTRPEMVTAVCSGGKLVVTVPKSKGD
ncbi:hypothetical protein TanjilG_01954 [Lupinus angustifolius]|uniref:uncharacterized protein LOC109335183 n=1 Tax=Lupinus angustifolius TaxID=3871 RepID=UPI00090E24C2|nr:PREDICTED: uncharacterized protein LOC109335183 [Lupinus angustifolius]OIV91336.1 hypothetical protein TanjilG_01954 [Lupinus angustifolius]